MKAVIHKKNIHNNQEDLITSDVFGSMSYLKDKIVSDVLINLINKKCKSNIEYIEEPSINYHFWPNISKFRRVEPDLIIELIDKNEENYLKIMFEFKWHSEQSTDESSKEPYQLPQQWSCIDSKDRKKTFHIYLVLDKKLVKHKIEKINPDNWKFNFYNWKQRLIVLSWQEFINFLNDNYYKSVSAEYKRWIEDVIEYYRVLELRFPPFRGFQFLSKNYKFYNHQHNTILWNSFFLFNEIGQLHKAKKHVFFYNT